MFITREAGLSLGDQTKDLNIFLEEFRGGSRGRVQGVRTPAPAEMTCGFLIQLVFCKKRENYVVYWC